MWRGWSAVRCSRSGRELHSGASLRPFAFRVEPPKPSAPSAPASATRRNNPPPPPPAPASTRRGPSLPAYTPISTASPSFRSPPPLSSPAPPSNGGGGQGGNWNGSSSSDLPPPPPPPNAPRSRWRRWLVRLLAFVAAFGLTWVGTTSWLVRSFAQKQWGLWLAHFDPEAYKRGGAPSPPLPPAISITTQQREDMIRELLASTSLPPLLVELDFSLPETDASVEKKIDCTSLAQLRDIVQTHSIRSSSNSDSSTAGVLLTASENDRQTDQQLDTLYLMLRAQLLQWEARVLLDAPRHWSSPDEVRIQVARELLERAAAISIAGLANYHRYPPHAVVATEQQQKQQKQFVAFTNFVNFVDAGLWLPDKGSFNFAWSAWTALLDSNARLSRTEDTKLAAKMMMTVAKQHADALHADDPAVTALILYSTQQFVGDRVASLEASSWSSSSFASWSSSKSSTVKLQRDSVHALHRMVSQGLVSRARTRSELIRFIAEPRAASTTAEETALGLCRLSHMQLQLQSQAAAQEALVSAQNAIYYLVPASAKDLIPPFVAPPEGPAFVSTATATAEAILPLHTILSPQVLEHVRMVAEANCDATPSSTSTSSPTGASVQQPPLPILARMIKACVPTSVLQLIFLRQRHTVATGYQQLGLALQAVGDQRQANIAFEFAEHMATMHLPAPAAAPKPAAPKSN